MAYNTLHLCLKIIKYKKNCKEEICMTKRMILEQLVKKKPWVSPYFSGRKKPDFQDICNGICEGACYGESCPGDLYH